MSFKDILIHLAEPDGASPAIAAAVSLAQRQGAHLTGLHVYSRNWPMLIADGEYMDPATLQKIMDESERAALEKAGRIRKGFEEVMRRETIRAEWQLTEGPVEATLVTRARYADIAIFGRSAEDTRAASLAEAVLFASGRPILLVPPSQPGRFAPDRILVGWNGSREAARAIADAMPLLRMAQAVQVMTLRSEDGEAAAIDAEDMARHLARHDARVTASTSTLGGLQAQDVLLDAASDFGADLLVVGGYGHGRLRERVLGGVTRSLFRHAPLPILLSH